MSRDFYYQDDVRQYSGMAFVTGLLAGAAIGAGIGLWFAPRPGTEFREQLSDSAKAMGKTVSETVDGLTDRGREVYDKARDVAARASKEFDRVTTQTAKTVDRGFTVANDITNAASAQARRA